MAAVVDRHFDRQAILFCDTDSVFNHSLLIYDNNFKDNGPYDQGPGIWLRYNFYIASKGIHFMIEIIFPTHMEGFIPLGAYSFL